MRSINPQFYYTKMWKQVRKQVWLKQHCICNRCKRPVYVDGISDYIPKEKRLKGIVHHIEYLNETNINNPEITIDENNLEGLCIECHNLEHIDTSTRKDVLFDEMGNLIQRDIGGYALK